MSNEYDFNNRPGQDSDGTSQTPGGAYQANSNQQPEGGANYTGTPADSGTAGYGADTGSTGYQADAGSDAGYGADAGTNAGTNGGYGAGSDPAYGSGYNAGGYSAPGYGTPSGYSASSGTDGGYGPTGGNTNPMSGYNVVPPKPPKKSGAKRIVAIAIVCAIIGGVGGGTAVGMSLRNGSSSNTTKSTTAAATEQTEEASSSDNTNTAINSTTINVTTNSEETDMTPQDVYEQYVNAVVAISNEGTTTNVFGQTSESASSGSGFIISSDGYIVTNNHVVEDAQKLTVTTTDGTTYDATVIGADEENDVALIKIDATGLPTVSIGDSDKIEVGAQLCAIGNPLGELTNTLTVGYVSALDREINENGTPINMFQTDCAINSGNSGGPIFDMHGNVVGITTAKYSSSSSMMTSTASIEGIGFCIPINDAMDIVNDLLQYGYVKGRPSLGITCQAISSTVTQYYNLPSGIYVNSVESGSAAETAGLQEGDIITAIDGTEVTSVTDFKQLLKNYQAGDTATLSIYRSNGGQTLDVSVTFDEKSSTTSNTTEQQQEQQQQQQTNPFSQSGDIS